MANSKQLEGRTFNREVYSRAMGGNLIALLKSHFPAIDKMDGSLLKQETPKALALKKPSLKEVDEHMASPYIPISVCIGTVLIVVFVFRSESQEAQVRRFLSLLPMHITLGRALI